MKSLSSPVSSDVEMNEPESEPILPEDILENQENILVDSDVLEIGADEEGDIFEGMPHLQDLSDDEDDGT